MKNGIPRWIKIIYTAFMAILVPIYWRDYGPTNFLYFCDIALFFTLAALWTEHPLLSSMPAVGILIPQALWIIDFLAGATGHFPFGLTTYMYDANIPLFTRGLSFFHFWLPLLLLWMVWRIGYDRRAFWSWTILAWIVLFVCYFLMPGPSPDRDDNTPANINYVFGMDGKAAQNWMAPHLYFAALLLGLPLFIYLPSHFILIWVGLRRSAH